MKTKQILQNVIKHLSEVFKLYSIELLLCAYIFIIVALEREKVILDLSFLILAPLFLSIAYIANNLTRDRYRIIYYLSWLPIIPLSLLNYWQEWIETPQCIITLCVLCPIAIVLSFRTTDNRSFIANLIRIIYTGFISVVFSGVTMGLFFATFFSAGYIFNFDDKVFEPIAIYALLSTGLLIFPMIFFSFLNRWSKPSWNGSRLFDMMINNIITPALLIYTAIIYIYAIKILFTWELPKGRVAYLVFGFTLFAITVKSLQEFIKTKRYNWYFNYFSIISIPALIMFWTGVIKRTGEYGFTEWRIYLLICGVIMTLCLLLFINKRFNRYIYVMVFGFISFAIMAYIPYFSAKEISLRSQKSRIEKLSSTIGLLNSDGKFINERRPISDTLYNREYQQLYSSLRYLERADKESLESFGITSYSKLLDIAPEAMSQKIQNPRILDDSTHDDIIYISQTSSYEIDDISKYNKFIDIRSEGPSYISSYIDDTLKISKDGSNILSIKGIDLLEAQLKKTGYTLRDIATDIPDSIKNEILLYRTDSLLIRFSSISLTRNDSNAEYKVPNIRINFILTK